MKTSRRLIPALIILACGFACTSCSVLSPQTDPSHFFVLSPIKPQGEKAFDQTIKLGLKRVEIPDYLHGRSIVVRVGDNELKYVDSSRWAESLDTALARVIREDLSARPEVDQVLVPPFSGDTERDFDLAFRVVNCEGIVKPGAKGSILFRVILEIYSTGAGAALVAQSEFKSEPVEWDGHDYGALATRLSEAAAQLCAQIPVTLAEIAGGEDDQDEK